MFVPMNVSFFDPSRLFIALIPRTLLSAAFFLVYCLLVAEMVSSAVVFSLGSWKT